MAEGFFSYLPPDPPPEPPERAAWRPPPWMQAPDDELPAVLAMPRILARTDQVVLTISVVEVFSVGVRIPLRYVVRRRGESEYEWHTLLQQHHHYPPLDGIRVGVELADGVRLGTHVEPHAPFMDREPAGPMLVNHGGGGGGGPERWDLTANLWLWPLPPAGTLEVIAEWRALQVPESRVVLDADVMRDAAGAVRPLWDD